MIYCAPPAANEIRRHYYLKRQAYVAAANRRRYVVETSRTPAVADGLAVMTEAYQRLGLDDRRCQPQDPSAQLTRIMPPRGRQVHPIEREDTRSWLSKATLGLIEGERRRPDPCQRDVLRQYETLRVTCRKNCAPYSGSGTAESAPGGGLTFGLFD